MSIAKIEGNNGHPCRTAEVGTIQCWNCVCPQMDRQMGAVKQRHHEANKFFKIAHVSKEGPTIIVGDIVKCIFEINGAVNALIPSGP